MSELRVGARECIRSTNTLTTIERHKYVCEMGFGSGESHTSKPPLVCFLSIKFIEISKTDAEPEAVSKSSYWGKEKKTRC